MTLAETAKKLGVSFYVSAHERISGGNKLPDLVELIWQQAPAFHPVPVLSPSGVSGSPIFHALTHLPVAWG
jgi:hypothetical protein